MPVVTGIILMLFGLAIIALGIVMRKKNKYTWVSLHSNVKPEDIEVFSKMNSQCMIGIGISVICMGLFFTIRLIPIGVILLLIGMVISMTIFFIAQSKYNN
jgi:xanthine/uracil permease